ncbi:amidase [Nocardia grenadensis]|uniref:amidase n=1 Tax=Nocardia grenadensis TaxID=931537 RepID=UPI003D70A236
MSLRSGGAGESGPAGPSAAAADIARQLNTVISWVPERFGTDTEVAGGPLAGYRLGVKDNIEIAGVRSTCGSEFFADRIAERDAAVVTRLKRAGATITCTLNLAEFAVGVTSQNSAAGGPRNPWDSSRVPGGSSGGSGAAVAAGLVDIALGTDTGGSIRLPAACCGIIGLRPSPGYIDTAGVYPVSPDFDTVGPLARTVAAVRTAYSVLVGEDLSAPSRDRLRVAVPWPFITTEIDPAIRDAFDTAARLLGDMGHTIIDAPVPHSDSAQDVVYTLLYSDLARLHDQRLRAEPHRFQPATLERISLGRSISHDQRVAALTQRDRFRAAMTDYFRNADVILTPTMPVDVPLITESAGVLAQSRRMAQLTYPWSLHDGPTLSVPIGFHRRSGMPIGAQLTAARGRETTLFALAEQLEQRTTWHRRRPPVRLG